MKESSIYEETDNKNIFHRIQTTLYKKIYLVFHVALKFEAVSILGVSFICTFELFQMLGYSFHTIFKSVWSIGVYEDIFFYLNAFFTIFQFIPYIRTTSVELYLAVFYLMIIFLLFIIGLFVYISRSLRSNSKTSILTLHVLKIILCLFNSVFLIPLLQIILPIFSCQTLLALATFTNEDISFCNSDVYIIHQVFAGIGLVITLIISFPVSLLYYDMKWTSRNYMAKESNELEVAMVVFKYIIVLLFECFSYLNSEVGYAYVLFFAYLILLYLLVKFTVFYHQFTRRAYNIIIYSLFITNSIVLLAFIIINYGTKTFDASFELWCLVILAIILYEVFRKDDLALTLAKSIESILTPRDALEKIYTLDYVVVNKILSQECSIILDGFLRLQLINLGKQKKPHSNRDENKTFLLHHTKLYEKALEKFPKDIPLRLSYAIFALDKLKNINLAKLHLLIASNNPSVNLSQRFSIYRFHKIIEEEYLNFDDVSLNVDIASTLIFDQYTKKFQENIEEIGLQFISFWNGFVQDDINISKINSTGFTLIELITNMFPLWAKMKSINPNDRDSLRNYGQFLIDILNEKHIGQEYITKSKEIQNHTNSFKLFKNDINTLGHDGSPVVLTIPEENGGLVISQVTNSFTRLFGYQKIEIIGKQISFLLPQQFRTVHDSAVGKYMKDKHHSKSIEYKRISGLGLHKNGFLFNVKFTLVLLPNLTTEPNLSIIIRKYKRHETYSANLLINKDLEVLNVSSECIKLFNMSDKVLWGIKNSEKLNKDEKLTFNTMIVELSHVQMEEDKGQINTQLDENGFTSDNKYMLSLNQSGNQKREKTFRILKEYMDPDDIQTVQLVDVERAYKLRTRDFVNSPSKKSDQLQLESRLSTKRKTSNFGVAKEFANAKILITENKISKRSTGTYTVYLSYDISSQILRSYPILNENKLMCFEREKLMYLIETKDNKKYRDLLELSRTQVSSPKRKKSFHTNVSQISNNENDIQTLLGIKDFGVDIKLYEIETTNYTIKPFPKNAKAETRRLVEIVETNETDTVITEDMSSEANNEDETGNLLQLNEKNKIEINKLQILSDNKHTNSTLLFKLKWSSFMFIVVNLILSFISFRSFTSQLDTADNFTNGILSLSTQLNYTITSTDVVLKMLVIGAGLNTRSSFLDELKLNANILYNISGQIDKNVVFNLPFDNTTLFNYIIPINRRTSFPSEEPIVLTYRKAGIHLMTKIFELTKDKNIELTITSKDAFYLINNSLNSFYLKGIEYINFLSNTFLSSDSTKESLILIYVTIALFIAFATITYLSLIDAIGKMNAIILEFLSIRPAEAFSIVKKSENFVKNIRINNMDEDEDEKEDDEEGMKDIRRNNKYMYKKLRREGINYFLILCMVLLVLVVFELFYVVNYFIAVGNKQTVDNFIYTYNATQRLNLNNVLLDAGSKVYLLSKSAKMINKNVSDALSETFDNSLLLKHEMLDIIQSSNSFSESLRTIYNQEILRYPLTDSSLLNFTEFIGKYFNMPSFENIQTDVYVSQLKFYSKIAQNGNFSNMVLDKDLFKSDTLEDEVVRPLMRIFLDVLHDDLKMKQSFLRNFELFWFAGYQGAIILLYLFVWIPIENKLENDVIIFLFILVPTNKTFDIVNPYKYNFEKNEDLGNSERRKYGYC